MNFAEWNFLAHWRVGHLSITHYFHSQTLATELELSIHSIYLLDSKWCTPDLIVIMFVFCAVLTAADIQPEHCVVEYADDQVFVHARDGKCYVNCVEVTQQMKVTHGGFCVVASTVAGCITAVTKPKRSATSTDKAFCYLYVLLLLLIACDI